MPRTKTSMRFGAPRHGGGPALEHAAERLPVVPRRAVPPLVVQLAVGSRGEHIEAVRRPGRDRRRRLDRAAEILPAAPIGLRPSGQT